MNSFSLLRLLLELEVEMSLYWLNLRICILFRWRSSAFWLPSVLRLAAYFSLCFFYRNNKTYSHKSIRSEYQHLSSWKSLELNITEVSYISLQIARGRTVVTSAALYHKQHARMFDNFAEIYFNPSRLVSSKKHGISVNLQKRRLRKLIQNNKEITWFMTWFTGYGTPC